MPDNAVLIEFARWVISGGDYEWYRFDSIDGLAIKDKAEELGLIASTSCPSEWGGYCELCGGESDSCTRWFTYSSMLEEF